MSEWILHTRPSPAPGIHGVGPALAPWTVADFSPNVSSNCSSPRCHHEKTSSMRGTASVAEFPLVPDQQEYVEYRGLSIDIFGPPPARAATRSGAFRLSAPTSTPTPADIAPAPRAPRRVARLNPCAPVQRYPSARRTNECVLRQLSAGASRRESAGASWACWVDAAGGRRHRRSSYVGADDIPTSRAWYHGTGPCALQNSRDASSCPHPAFFPAWLLTTGIATDIIRCSVQRARTYDCLSGGHTRALEAIRFAPSIYKKSHRNIINWRFSAFMLGEGSPKPHRFASAAFTAGAKPLRWRWPFPLARGLSLGRSLSADAGLFRWRGAFLLFFLFYVKSLFLARCAEHFRSPLGPLCRAFSLAAGPAAQSFTLAARPTAWCRPTSGVYTVNVIDSVMGAPDASRR
ncbi:hypothetical protein C8R44DRAFT_987717 [Mycena epipterygia]|nr:hypothetical protein C8R44DRAFT_987717 [Mycena epipterygia]